MREQDIRHFEQRLLQERAIGAERLDLVPWARFCLDCKTAEEAS
jgi:RNA polymerase-binding transcription factor DksA